MKITDEMLVRLSHDSEDNEDFDFEENADDVEERPWKPSESRLEGGVNRAKLKFSKIITTTSRVSVRNIIESAREGSKQIASE
jgi:hypothetical protein